MEAGDERTHAPDHGLSVWAIRTDRAYRGRASDAGRPGRAHGTPPDSDRTVRRIWVDRAGGTRGRVHAFRRGLRRARPQDRTAAPSPGHKSGERRGDPRPARPAERIGTGN